VPTFFNPPCLALPFSVSGADRSATYEYSGIKVEWKALLQPSSPLESCDAASSHGSSESLEEGGNETACSTSCLGVKSPPLIAFSVRTTHLTPSAIDVCCVADSVRPTRMRVSRLSQSIATCLCTVARKVVCIHRGGREECRMWRGDTSAAGLLCATGTYYSRARWRSHYSGCGRRAGRRQCTRQNGDSSESYKRARLPRVLCQRMRNSRYQDGTFIVCAKIKECNC